jgi:hypothetical protein
MGKPPEERLTKKLAMEDHLRDENLDVPARPRPESPPSSPDEKFELLPFGSFFCTLNTPLQPGADM